MPLVIYAFGGRHTPVPHECNFKNAGHAKVSSLATVYCKSFEVEKFCGFCRSICNRKTFPVKHFHFNKI